MQLPDLSGERPIKTRISLGKSELRVEYNDSPDCNLATLYFGSSKREFDCHMSSTLYFAEGLIS